MSVPFVQLHAVQDGLYGYVMSKEGTDFTRFRSLFHVLLLHLLRGKLLQHQTDLSGCHVLLAVYIPNNTYITHVIPVTILPILPQPQPSCLRACQAGHFR